MSSLKTLHKIGIPLRQSELEIKEQLFVKIVPEEYKEIQSLKRYIPAYKSDKWAIELRVLRRLLLLELSVAFLTHNIHAHGALMTIYVGLMS
ncbi:hypothetical protein C0991_007244 [Blastosporella zonata]|nr:hypothetical protein C0991_007244 [Blastosporella zonata]